MIIDPEITDLGVAIFASRDITNFKEARRQTPPATWRKFSISDAIYIGGIRNQKPVQYIHFRNDGIEIYSPKRVHITTPTVLIDSDNTTINTSAKTTINANGGCEINAETTNNGNVKINGNTKISGNLLVGGIIGQTGEGGESVGICITLRKVSHKHLSIKSRDGTGQN